MKQSALFLFMMLNGERAPESVKLKSFFIPPIGAYVEGGELIMSFSSDMDVNISIISVDDGSVVHTGKLTVTSQTVVPIDLTGIKKGIYEIIFQYNDSNITGEFEL